MELSVSGAEKKQHKTADSGSCRNCNQPVNDNYCSYCGTAIALKRVDGHYIIHEIQHVLHFEKGILYTIKALLTRPGESIRTFLSQDRSRLVKPVLFIIITSLIYTAIIHFFHLEKEHAGAAGPAHSATKAMRAWVEGHYGYANIIMGIFIGLWLKLLRWKSGYNFFEVLIMLCFVMGTGMLIFSIFALLEAITRHDMLIVSGIVALIYCVWAIAQFLNGKKVANYIFALIAYLLGMESFSSLISLIGFLIDSFHKA